MPPLPPRPNRLLAVLLLAAAVVVVAWVYHHRDRMAAIAPRVVLSRNGGDWSLLHDSLTPPGLEPRLGGTVVADDLTGVEVIDTRYVIGATAAEEHFILTLRDPPRDENDEERIERFPPGQHNRWLARCRALGIPHPQLRPPEPSRVRHDTANARKHEARKYAGSPSGPVIPPRRPQCDIPPGPPAVAPRFRDPPRERQRAGSRNRGAHLQDPRRTRRSPIRAPRHTPGRVPARPPSRPGVRRRVPPEANNPASRCTPPRPTSRPAER